MLVKVIEKKVVWMARAMWNVNKDAVGAFVWNHD